MVRYLVAYLATAVVFLGIDSIWLTNAGPALYRPVLGDILAPAPSLAPAVLFYLLFVAGILIFCTAPAFATGRWTAATQRGALFGLFTYATYDLTNQATLRSWSTTITVADMAWGAFLTAVAATAGYLVTRRLVGGGP